MNVYVKEKQWTLNNLQQKSARNVGISVSKFKRNIEFHNEFNFRIGISPVDYRLTFNVINILVKYLRETESRQ